MEDEFERIEAEKADLEANGEPEEFDEQHEKPKAKKRRPRIVSYNLFMPRLRLLWYALPEHAREAIKTAGKAAIDEAFRVVERKKFEFHSDQIVSAYIYSLVVARLESIKRELIEPEYYKSISSPPSRIHSLGFWFDELKLPEELVWLLMTVPRRVWYQLAVNPIKRHKFLQFIEENFSDETPLDRK